MGLAAKGARARWAEAAIRFGLLGLTVVGGPGCSRAQERPADDRPPLASHPTPEPRRMVSAEPSADVTWCVSGAAAVAGAPLLDAEERLYFVSTDGTLHAFENDGRYRFAFTLEGSPLGSPSLRKGDATLLLGTSARRVYAIAQTGSLRWKATTPSPVWSSIVPLGDDQVAYLGLDRHLYVLGTGGAARYRVALPKEPIGEPSVDPASQVWLPVRHGLLRVRGAHELRSIELSADPESLVQFRGGVAVWAAGQAIFFDAEGRETGREAADGLGAGSGDIVLSRGAALQWRRAAGNTEFDAALPAPPSAEPVVAGKWLAWALEDGQVAFFDSEGRQVLRRIGTARLGPPVRGPRHWFVPGADGRICAVEEPPVSAGRPAVR